MRFLFYLFCLVPNFLFSQDTLNFVKHYDNTKTFWIAGKKDTIMYSYYPNGKKETERKYNYNGKTIIYKRWYESGKLMWERETVNEIANGKTIYYDEKGSKVAELIFKNDSITDTVYIKNGIHLVLGKITFRNVVYGGAVNADGTSNVSDYSGNYMYCNMYAAKVDSLKKPELIQYFRSDHRGEFFVLVPQGKIGFFPQSYPIDKLNPNEFYPPQTMWKSGNEGWNMKIPDTINSEDKISWVLLHHSSTGYAP